MSQLTLNLLVIYAQDMAASERFYAALGLRFASEQHGRGPEHRAAELGDLVLEIYPASEHTPATSARLGFVVDNMQDRVAALVAAGGQIVKPPELVGGARRAVVRDPDGRKVELTEPCRKPGRCC